MTLPKHLWRYAFFSALAAGLVAGLLLTRSGGRRRCACPPCPSPPSRGGR